MNPKYYFNGVFAIPQNAGEAISEYWHKRELASPDTRVGIERRFGWRKPICANPCESVDKKIRAKKKGHPNF